MTEQFERGIAGGLSTPQRVPPETPLLWSKAETDCTLMATSVRFFTFNFFMILRT
jgi:hypothetical protein